MARIDPDLENRLRKNPQNTVRVIVRIGVDPSEAESLHLCAGAEARFKELDATVLYAFSLIRAVALSCLAETALALLQEPWVEAIEEDRQVSVQA